MLALHYGGETLSKPLKHIAQALKPGGLFLCMVLDCDFVKTKRDGVAPMKIHEWETVDGDSKTRIWVSLEGTMTALPEWLLSEDQLKMAGEEAGFHLMKSENALQGLETLGWQQWLTTEDTERIKTRTKLETLKTNFYGKQQWDTKHWEFVQQYKVYLFQKRA
jgi:hypothetical protein